MTNRDVYKARMLEACEITLKSARIQLGLTLRLADDVLPTEQTARLRRMDGALMTEIDLLRTLPKPQGAAIPGLDALEADQGD